MSTVVIAHLRHRQRLRSVVVVLLAVTLCVGLLVATLGMGVAGVPPGRALPAILGQGDRLDVLVVQDLRLPRAIAAVLAGVAFGLAGALFQSTLRNSLASPDILGISAGASLGAITAILGPGLVGWAVTGSAFAGAVVVAVAIWAFAWRGGLHGVRFVLVGVGMAYVCTSLIAWRLAAADQREAGAALLWTVGSVAEVRSESLGLLAIGVLVFGAGGLVIGREQRPLALGDDHAHSLGVGATRSRGTALFVGVALVAIATAVTGPIAFVALVAPAIARRLVDDGGPALAASGALGAALTLAADVLGQYGLPGVTAPVGIVTGLVGAPYLLWLLARSERSVAS